MTSFSKQLSFRWSDLDPNFHVRHSVLRWCAASYRNSGKSWLDHESLQTGHFGPILFREECIFRKEIGLSDTIFMHTKFPPDASVGL
jgi:acyl-CoA thioester hydrolase